MRHREPTAQPGDDVNAQAGPSAYALLTEGTTIEIRPARPDDFDAVRDMHVSRPDPALKEQTLCGGGGTSPIPSGRAASRSPLPGCVGPGGLLDGAEVAAPPVAGLGGVSGRGDHGREPSM